jgi:hypothetical protein
MSTIVSCRSADVRRLHGMSALQAWSGSGLLHLGGMKHPAAATPAGATPNQDLQTLGAHMAKHCRLGT